MGCFEMAPRVEASAWLSAAVTLDCTGATVRQFDPQVVHRRLRAVIMNGHRQVKMTGDDNLRRQLKLTHADKSDSPD